MKTCYLSKDPVSVALTPDVAALDGKTVLVTDGDDQFIMEVLVIPEPEDEPKVCRVILQDASVCSTDSWSAIGCTPAADRRPAASEYLTAEGLALVQPSEKTLPLGATFSFTLPNI